MNRNHFENKAIVNQNTLKRKKKIQNIHLDYNRKENWAFSHSTFLPLI
jgi:hypothetical protein